MLLFLFCQLNNIRLSFISSSDYVTTETITFFLASLISRPLPKQEKEAYFSRCIELNAKIMEIRST